MRTIAILSIVSVLLLSCNPNSAVAPDAAVSSINKRQITFVGGEKLALPTDKSIVICVRHAEKDTTVKSNPNLNRAGINRSDRLADILADAGLTGVYSTPFKRTLMTASPTAGRQQLSVTPYRAAGIPQLARSIKTAEEVQRLLVVGHSNTVPGFINQLMGKAQVRESIPETDYSRLYVVIMDKEPILYELWY